MALSIKPFPHFLADASNAVLLVVSADVLMIIQSLQYGDFSHLYSSTKCGVYRIFVGSY